MSDPDIELLRMLAERLERLSVDSIWARRASGLRGNIVKLLGEFEADQDIEPARLSLLIQHAFEILRRAAQEIPDTEDIKKE